MDRITAWAEVRLATVMKEGHHQLSKYGFRDAVKLNSRILICVCIACFIRLKNTSCSYQKMRKMCWRILGTQDCLRSSICSPRQVAYLKSCIVLCLLRFLIVNLASIHLRVNYVNSIFLMLWHLGTYRLPLPGKLIPKDNDNLPTYVSFIYNPVNPKFKSPTTSLSNSSMTSQNFPCPKSLLDQGPSK